MKFSAVRAAKSFAATHGVKLSERQYVRFVSALARSYADVYNKGYLAHKAEIEENGGSGSEVQKAVSK